MENGVVDHICQRSVVRRFRVQVFYRDLTRFSGEISSVGCDGRSCGGLLHAGLALWPLGRLGCQKFKG